MTDEGFKKYKHERPNLPPTSSGNKGKELQLLIGTEGFPSKEDGRACLMMISDLVSRHFTSSAELTADDCFRAREELEKRNEWKRKWRSELLRFVGKTTTEQEYKILSQLTGFIPFEPSKLRACHWQRAAETLPRHIQGSGTLTGMEEYARKQADNHLSAFFGEEKGHG